MMAEKPLNLVAGYRERRAIARFRTIFLTVVVQKLLVSFQRLDLETRHETPFSIIKRLNSYIADPRFVRGCLGGICSPGEGNYLGSTYYFQYTKKDRSRLGTNQLQFTGTPAALVAYLTKVMMNAIISTLRKREVKTSRSGKTKLADELIEDPAPPKAETLFELRSLMRDDAFREALRECTADDDALQDYILAIETFEDTIPAARDIASLLGVPETEIYNRRRKLARRLGNPYKRVALEALPKGLDARLSFFPISRRSNGRPNRRLSRSSSRISELPTTLDTEY